MTCDCGGVLEWKEQMLKKEEGKYFDYHILKCLNCGREKEVKFRTEI